MHEAAEKRPITKLAFALVIVSFLLSTAVSLVSMQMMSERNEREVNRVLATQINDYINSELSGPIMAARTMANNSFLIDALQNEEQIGEQAVSASIADYLAGIEDGLGYHSAFVVSDASGNYYMRSGPIRVVDRSPDGQDSWYVQFAESDADYDLNVNNDEKNPNDLTVYVNVKVKDDRRALLGVCGVGLRMTGIQELFRTFESSFGVKIDLVDSDGVVQVDTNDESISAQNLGNLIDGKKSGEYVYDELGGGKFAITKYVEDLGWYLVVQSGGGNKTGQFANVIILNAALCVVVLIALFVALRINRRRTNDLTSASMIDHPTGLYNKRAFGQAMTNLSKSGLDADFVYATVDVNGLKTVNDNLGHDAGDELIKGAADCLKKCFGKQGSVYRVGGDEFAVLMYASEEQLEALKAELERTVAAWSGATVSSLAVSCGYASAREFPDMGPTELGKISDERMYEDKRQYYERTGFDRRRR